MQNKKRLLIIVLAFLSGDVLSHGGRLDKNGGHREKATNSYHCHREPCLSRSLQTATALKEAQTEKRAYSLRYNREDWKHWLDDDNDCMNTRHEILLAQADGAVKRSPDGCYISTGTWHDPYSGKTFHRASDLDIDHVIPLKWAHEHGGANWPKAKKTLFANDPDNLLAVDDGLNQSKGAQGPTEWLPPNHPYRCQYLQHWQKVMAKYKTLKMTPSERRTFNKQLAHCR